MPCIIPMQKKNKVLCSFKILYNEKGRSWHITWNIIAFVISVIPLSQISIFPRHNCLYSLTLFFVFVVASVFIRIVLSLNFTIQYGLIWNIHEYQGKCERQVVQVKPNIGFKGQNWITCYARDFLSEKSQLMCLSVLVSRKENCVLTYICNNLDILKIFFLDTCRK